MGNKNITTTACGHTFCFSCITKSMDAKNACPCCRAPLREQVEEESVDSYHNSVTCNRVAWQLLMCCGKVLLAIAVFYVIVFSLLCILFFAGAIGP